MLFIPFVFLALVIACDVLTVIRPQKLTFLPHKPSAKAWVWNIFFSFLLLFSGVYTSLGLITASPFKMFCCSLLFAFLAVAELFNDKIRSFLAELEKPLRITVEFVLLLLGAYLCFLAVEMPSNPYLTEFYWEGLIIEVLIIFVVMLIFHFIFQRSGFGEALSALLFWFAGLAEYFVVTFKGVPILASDIFAVGTAAAVSTGYTFSFSTQVLSSLMLLSLVIALVSFTPKLPETSHKIRRIGINIGSALLIGIASALFVINVSFIDTFGVWYNAWLPLDSYQREGFITSLVSQFQSFSPKKPKGYTKAKAEKLLADYAETYDKTLGAGEQRRAAEEQYARIKPNVVFIMNETFADLSIYNELGQGYSGPAWFNSFDGALAKGPLSVSVYGGGTCNSEWEFFTGCSKGFMGPGVTPYMVYSMKGVENLAAQLKGAGYGATAMHPNLAANWQRNVVYPTFGFDEFLDIDDFASYPRIRNFITDEGTYDKIMDILKQSSDSHFVADITMQNHGGYLTGALPENTIKPYYIQGEEDLELEEYLALIDISDKALEDFISQLSNFEEPTVVVFFGDHQPSIGSKYNDLFMTDEEKNSLAHQQRAYTTSYMIYANYDVAGTDATSTISSTSTNFLAANMAQIIGMPLTDFQKAQLVMQDKGLGALNALGYTDNQGTWHELSDIKGVSTGKLRQDLETLQYYQLFGNGVHFQGDSGHSGEVFGRIEN